MVHFIIVPAFAVHDCAAYYNVFTVGVGDTHSVQFLSVDGYTHSGRCSLGDVSLKHVVEECVQACNRENRPYVLVGHSTGALLVGHMYAQLEHKPLSIMLFNPISHHPRLWLCRCIPLVVPLMRLLDLLPVPLITPVWEGRQFGTVSDVVPAMKYRLWIDLSTVACRVPLTTGLPSSTTTVFTSLHDRIGTGGERIQCENHHTTKCPGHASFRSMECMSVVLGLLRSYTPTEPAFTRLCNLDDIR